MYSDVVVCVFIYLSLLSFFARPTIRTWAFPHSLPFSFCPNHTTKGDPLFRTAFCRIFSDCPDLKRQISYRGVAATTIAQPSIAHRELQSTSSFSYADPVHQVQRWFNDVELEMSRRQDGPSRTGGRGVSKSVIFGLGLTVLLRVPAPILFCPLASAQAPQLGFLLRLL